MLDKENPKEAKIIEEMKEFVSEGHGISFALAMRDPEGEVSLSLRQNQPCYGELRKYHASHGEEYTDPKPHDTYRPDDLYDPFPEGIPEAVAIPCYGNPLSLFHKEMLSEESPFPLGDISSIILEEKGFILLDTMIDPTVMVNLFNSMRSVNLELYESARNEGLSVRQAFALVSHIGGWRSPNFRLGYYHSPCADFWKIENAKPNDLTGGLFRDRYDYNRKRLHDVFSVEDGGKKINHVENISKMKSVDEFKSYYEEAVGKQTPA